MYRSIQLFLLAIIFGLVLPGILLAGAFPAKQQPFVETEPFSTTMPTDAAVYLPILSGGKDPVLMDLESYITCVLLMEIPSDFHEEAMKAQAVAARTYALRRFETGFKHQNAALCTDPSCCQAYRSAEQFLADGGTQEALQKIRSAVAETAGEVLYYEGDLIEATYFSSSGGMTEAAVAVWGEDIPYLQARESPGEESATHHTDTVNFTWEEAADLLGVPVTGLVHSGFTDIHYTAGGGVDTLHVCGKTFTGKELRSLMGLRSTAFSIYPSEEGISIVTRGFGHRVGMSQYGANAMAAEGKNYKEILSHYYVGTELLVYDAS